MTMKKVSRIVALLLILVMMLSVVACGNKGKSGKSNLGKYNGGKEVEIKYWNAGQGTNDFAMRSFIPSFCASNAADRVTADEAWKTIQDVFESEFDRWLDTVK